MLVLHDPALDPHRLRMRARRTDGAPPCRQWINRANAARPKLSKVYRACCRLRVCAARRHARQPHTGITIGARRLSWHRRRSAWCDPSEQCGNPIAIAARPQKRIWLHRLWCVEGCGDWRLGLLRAPLVQRNVRVAPEPACYLVLAVSGGKEALPPRAGLSQRRGPGPADRPPPAQFACGRAVVANRFVADTPADSRGLETHWHAEE
jgi:hypothetical protein